jgi:peptide/nickel transport system substrate-binding protein
MRRLSIQLPGKWLGLLLILTFLLSACVAQVPPPEATGEATEAEAAAEGGDTLRLIWWQAPTILNPHLATGGKDFDASRIVYEPLASFNSAGELIPFLAAEAPSLENGGVAADGLSVTWKLKPDVLWSDGEPFTADDVKFTYEYLSNPETGATTAANYSAVASVEVIDPLTVKVNFNAVTPAWSVPFTGINGQIIPEHIFKEFVGAKSREAAANLAPIGTGPFKVVEFIPGDTVVYERNELFREEGKPFFSRVELKGGGDATSAARAVLQTGDADFAWGLFVEASVLTELEKGGQGRLVLNPGSTGEFILLNQSDPNIEVDGERSSATTTHPFLTDINVRKAIALAIDRQTIVDQLFGIAGVTTSNVLLAPKTYLSPNTSFEYDIEKAAALLDEAGWIDSDGDGVREKDGVKLELLYQTTVNPQRQKVQEIVKQSLESIGFKVELKSIDGTIFFSSDPSNPDTFRHFYADIQMYTTGSFSPDPNTYMKNWTSDQIPQKANNWSGANEIRWRNAEYDALYLQSTTELDPERRREIFIQLNDILINEAVIIPLIHRTGITAASNRLQGVELSAWESNVWLIKDWYFQAE